MQPAQVKVGILCEDSYPIVAAGVKSALAEAGMRIESVPRLRSVRRADSVSIPPTLDVLVYICNGNRDDLEGELRQVRDNASVVVVDCDLSGFAAVPSLAGGALAYIRLDQPLLKLVKAVEAASRQDRYLTQEAANALLEAADRRSLDARSPAELLTPREYEIMLALGQGLTAKKVAFELGISVKTVNTHRSSVLGKLGLRNQGELIRYCVARGLC